MMSKISRSARHGFTLIEIMIVVLIIGILLAIAVPNFIKARETSRIKACVANLKQIDSAKEQWAMDKKVADGGAIVQAEVDDYMKSPPACPTSGAYTYGVIGTDPVCNQALHVLP